MPIRVKCSCQQQFDARDELAGKTVKCPKCGSALTIPRPAATASVARPAAVPPPSSAIASLLDEAGVKQRSAAGCPACGAEIPPEAVLCVQCGFNFRTGRKLETRSVATGPSDGLGDGHGVNSEFLIQKARDDMAAEQLMQKKLVSFGIPWWGYLLILIGMIGFIVGMGSLPQHVAMKIAGWILISAGSVMLAAAYIWMIVASFKVSAMWGLIVLLIPGIGALVFAFTNWDEGAGPFFILLGGGLVIGLAFFAWWLSSLLSKGEGQVMLDLIQKAIPA